MRNDGWNSGRKSGRKSGYLGLTAAQPGGLRVGKMGGAILVVVRVTLRCSSFLWLRGWT